ncbi:MAG TPA: ester cyclase [Polyangia bacterium]|nr:ester cyclase [Polyangia bacterium]
MVGISRRSNFFDLTLANKVANKEPNMKTNRWIVLGALAGLAAAGGVAQAKKISNRQVLERWFEVIDAKQLDKFGDVETADMEMKTPMGVTKGTQGHVQMTRMFAAAFPNFKHTVSHCVESAENIACEGKFAGDNTGPMMMPNGQSLPASNKHVEFDFACAAIVKNGKIASAHAYFDMLGMMQQLGAIPGGKS